MSNFFLSVYKWQRQFISELLVEFSPFGRKVTFSSASFPFLLTGTREISFPSFSREFSPRPRGRRTDDDARRETWINRVWLTGALLDSRSNRVRFHQRIARWFYLKAECAAFYLRVNLFVVTGVPCVAQSRATINFSPVPSPAPPSPQPGLSPLCPPSRIFMRTAAGTFHCSIGYLFMDVARQKRDFKRYVRSCVFFLFVCFSIALDHATSTVEDRERIIIRGRKKKKNINERKKKNKKRARERARLIMT